MNLPNRVTLARIAAAPLLVVTLSLTAPMWQFISAVLFVLISLTDLLDGFLARSRNQVTDLGKFLDPIADKLLVTAAMVVLVGQQRMDAWVVILFISREFIISAFRLVASTKGVVVGADRLGKYKTLAQTVGLTMLMLLTPAGGAPVVNWGAPGVWMARIVIYAALVLSVWSCVNYMVKNKAIL